MSEFWNSVYSNNPGAYGDTPNQFFKQCLDSIETPGTILLPGEGPGRNACYAAQQGWRVLAFDASEVAIKLARERALQLGVPVDFSVADYNQYTLPTESVDALAFIFTHQPSMARPDFHKRFLSCLRPGGSLIAQYYHFDQLQYGTGGPSHEDMLCDLEMLKRDFDGVEWVKADHQVLSLSEGAMHQGRSSTLQLFGTKS